jgi:GNAT superfamily N-acetyltransferase
MIRFAVFEDSPALAILLTQLGYPSSDAFVQSRLTELSKSGSACVIVAEHDGAVVGFLAFNSQPLFHQAGRVGNIMAMSVLENMRGQGVGKKLVQEAEKIASESGCLKMAVASGLHRTDTHKFYTSLGYAENTKRFVKQLGHS